MKIIESLDQLNNLGGGGSVLAIGHFDGVHVGHQAIMRQGRALADQHHLPFCVMTFDPAPVKVLRPELAPRILTPTKLKQRLLGDLGVDTLIVIPTSAEFLAQEPEDFVREVVVGRLHARHIVEGGTFGFGRRRSGSVQTLTELGAEHGFAVHSVTSASLELEGFDEPVAVSSTFVRQEIAECNFGTVRECLGRYYELPGTVTAAAGRGHRIGFPTANLQLYNDDQLVPQDGVYAGYVRLGRDLHETWASRDYRPAAISIGSCETFADGQWQIEAHILDYEADKDALYEQHLLMGLVRRTRAQTKFDSAEELIARIKRDCEEVRLALLSDPPPA